jgi:hypothetical protein
MKALTTVAVAVVVLVLMSIAGVYLGDELQPANGY